jgi:hypothetical protein
MVESVAYRRREPGVRGYAETTGPGFGHIGLD